MHQLQIFFTLSSKVLGAYSHVPIKVKIFICMRLVTAAFFALEKVVPKKGRVLDLGCGHGVFSVVLALTSKYRQIVGIDPDVEKIAVAAQIQSSIHSINPRLSFSAESLQNHSKKNPKYSAITIVDVTYLLPSKTVLQILRVCKKMLSKNGVVVLKTSQKEQSLGHFLAVLQEKIMVQFLQKTKSDHSELHFKTIAEYKDIFAKAGFTIQLEQRLRTLFFHPHYVFVLKAVTPQT